MLTSSIARRGILQPIDRRLGDELEPGGAQLLEQRAQRDLFRGGDMFEIGERKPGDRQPPSGRRDFADALDRRRARRGRAGDPHLAGGSGNVDRRTGLRGDIRDPDKGGARAVTRPPHFVGLDAKRDDVGASGERRQFSV